MATVCRFFPSQSVGKPSAGSGDPTPALYPERQTLLLKPSLVGDGARAPHLLKAGLSFIKPADVEQARKLFAFTFTSGKFRGNHVMQARETRKSLLSAQIEG
jgi:hypothetical protein